MKQHASMESMEVKDSNGNLLKEGDSVVVIKSLKVKGGNTIKQGTVVKNIKHTSNDEEIEGRVDKVPMVLKACYLKKA